MTRRLFALASLMLFAICLVSSIPGPALAKTSLKLGIVTTPGSAQHVAAMKFKELLEARSYGKMDVTIYHSGALGTETEILQQIQLGAVDMGVITLGPFDTFVQQVKVVSFPFMFSSYQQVDRVLDGPLGAEVLQSLEAAQFKGLAFSENGFRNLTNDTRPVHSVSDVAGLKIRVMESVLHRELWKTLGANPTPMGWPIYTELQQGTIDGQENPLWVAWKYKLFEVQQYLSLTGHVYSAHIAVYNLAKFNALPKADQELVTTAMQDAAHYQRNWNRKNVADFLSKLKNAGMIVEETPDLSSFKTRAESLKDMDVYSDPATKALLERFLAATK